MTTTHCDYCGHHIESRLVKQVDPPEWEDGGMACAGCRGRLDEIDTLHEQDRIDAARWRALRPFLGLSDEAWQTRWLQLERVPPNRGGTVDEIVDKLVQIAQEQQ